MKLSKGFWHTYKETPADAEIASHQLAIRAGLIHKQGAGLYTFLPMGLRSLRKIETIIRQELQKANAMEVSLPVVTAGELWQESGRLESFGPEMLTVQDRNGKPLCVSPTNEEAITDVFRSLIRSYKQLPVNLYQIHTKFRNEIRPRYGLMRAREFIMKDAYSFHDSWDSLNHTYEQMYQVYSNIFSRLGLEFMVVEADAGAMADGKSQTHEFQVLAKSGEDKVIRCLQSGYAANLEKASTKRASVDFFKAAGPIKKIATPKMQSIDEVSSFLQRPAYTFLKSLIYEAIYADSKSQQYMVVLLGDDNINEVKLKGFLGAAHLRLAADSAMMELGIPKGFMGPYQLENISQDITVIYDQAIDMQASYVVGAMEDDFHLDNFVPQRDGVKQNVQITDLRMATAGDICPQSGLPVEEIRGIEVGHIFQLGSKYTESMKATVLNEQGKAIHPFMGCYGIGVTRTLAAALEQNHDDKGIIWPVNMAPFHIYFAVISKKEEYKKKANEIYQQLIDAGLEVLLDDRGLGAGFMFKDSDLLGLPLRLVLGEREYSASKLLEIKVRKTDEVIKVNEKELVCTIEKIMKKIV